MEYIEISAKTVDDAVTEAVIQLGTTHDQLEYEVRNWKEGCCYQSKEEGQRGGSYP